MSSLCHGTKSSILLGMFHILSLQGWTFVFLLHSEIQPGRKAPRIQYYQNPIISSYCSLVNSHTQSEQVGGKKAKYNKNQLCSTPVAISYFIIWAHSCVYTQTMIHLQYSIKCSPLYIITKHITNQRQIKYTCSNLCRWIFKIGS